MNRKLLIPLAIIILIVFGIVLSYFSLDSPTKDIGSRKTFNVSSEGAYDLHDIIQDIKKHSYYDGYDNETVEWMESLGSKKVFFSTDEIIIMDSGDAMKIPTEFVTDMFINEIFEAEVVENRPLGNIEHPRDVILVNNVEFLNQEIHDLGLA